MSLRKTLRRHRGWIAVGSAIAIGGLVLLITRQAEPAVTGPTYTTQDAVRGTLSVTVDGTGYLAVRDEVEVWPQVTGDISTVDVAVGERVEQGDVLYVLDDEDVRKSITKAKAAKRQAQQSLERARLELLQAETSLSRLEEQSSAPSVTVSPSDLTIARKQIDIAEIGVAAAEASYNSASAEYVSAVDGLSDLEVTSPCDGVVWSVGADPGDSVSTGAGSTASAGGGTDAGTSTGGSASSAPVTVARDGLLGVELEVNEVDVTAIRPGQDVEVAFDAVSDLRMTGTVDEVASSGTVSSGVVTYGVWLTLDGSDKRLRPGMSATATIVTLVQRDALLVPNSAIKTAEDGTSYVEVLQTGASSPQVVAVVTGASSATQTVIDSGIEAGVSVVTKTTKSTDGATDSASSDEPAGGTGIMMMGAGGPPAGGPGGQ